MRSGNIRCVRACERGPHAREVSMYMYVYIYDGTVSTPAATQIKHAADRTAAFVHVALRGCVRLRSVVVAAAAAAGR